MLRPVIREALGLLTTDGKAIVVRLHPMDLRFSSHDHARSSGMTLTLKVTKRIARRLSGRGGRYSG